LRPAGIGPAENASGECSLALFGGLKSPCAEVQLLLLKLLLQATPMLLLLLLLLLLIARLAACCKPPQRGMCLAAPTGLQHLLEVLLGALLPGAFFATTLPVMAGDDSPEDILLRSARVLLLAAMGTVLVLQLLSCQRLLLCCCYACHRWQPGVLGRKLRDE
jgi:hypothetical protein